MESPELPLSQTLIRLKALLKRRLKSSKKYLLAVQEKLTDALSWQKQHHEAELLQANLYLLKRGAKEIEISDWEKEGALVTLTLDPKLLPQEEVSARFKKSKKLRLGIEPLKNQLEKAAREQTRLADMLNSLEGIQNEEELEVLKTRFSLPIPQQKPSKKIPKEPSKPYLEFFSASGIPIWVGKNAKGNDQLTFHLANGNDTWLHAAGFSGSHVVIRSSKEIDEEALKDALQLALQFSKAKNEGQAEVCLTKRKFVSRLGKAAGKVQVSQQKVFFVKADPQRLLHLKQRCGTPA